MVEEESSVMSNQVDDGGIPMNKIFPRNMAVSTKEIETILRKNNVKLKINDIISKSICS